jgi:hypothetical protein
MNMFRQTYDGRLDRQYLRVCATFKLLKLCKIDETRAVELLAERRIHNAHSVVRHWVNSLERNEWANGILGQRTITGNAYLGPRP